MKEFGLKIPRGDDTFIFVFFKPLTYMDYIIYSPVNVRYDEPAIRALLAKYITRIISEGNDDYDIYNLLTESPGILTKVIDSIIAKSYFEDETFFMDLVDHCDKKSRSIMGTYDSFLLSNLSFETYMGLLECDIYTRAQAVAVLEKLKNFKIRERYEHASKYNIPVNLVDDGHTYRKWLKEESMKNPQLKEVLSRKPEDTKPADNNIDLKEGADISTMLQDAQSALAEALQRDKHSPSKTFDWESEEDFFTKNE